MIDQYFKLLRIKIRQEGRSIINHIKRNHFEPNNFAGEDDICVFCGSEEKLTREHVLPRWSFQNDTERYFTTNVNDSRQTFIKTTIPACQNCNNNILSNVERYINNLLINTDLNADYFEYEETLNIIRWLEIIEYKFHILEFRRKFRIKKSSGYIPILRDVPMSVMRLSVKLFPYKALSQLRLSQSRISRKEKDSRYYSLVIYKNKNKQSLSFHSLEEFIYLELPEYKMAMFYFYNEEFESNYKAEEKARSIIKQNYQ